MAFLKKQPWLPKTLFWRFALIILCPVIFLQAIAIYIFWERHWDSLARNLSGSLSGEILIITELLENKPADEWPDLFALIQQRLNMDIVFLPQENLVSIPSKQKQNFLVESEKLLRRSLSQHLNYPFQIIIVDDDRQVQVKIELPEGLLSLTTTRKRLFSSTTYIFILWMVASSLILAFVSLLFMRNQIRPMRRLALAMDRFGKGRDIKSFKPQGAFEIRQAAAAFNVMQERIGRQITQRTEMLAGISHDLRTPLARMKLVLAMLPDGPEIAEIQKNLDEMRAMIDSYLDFVRGEGGEESTEIDLSQLLRDAAAHSLGKGEITALHIPDQCMIQGRPQALGRCFTNLINNAKRYAKKIEITLEEDQAEERMIIMIDDNGPGIPETLYEDVFRPFFRTEQSRNKETGGIGLGLTIARDIARAHGGDITLGKAPILGGLRAKIKLPL